MLSHHCIAGIILTALISLGSGAVFSQHYPIKPVRIVTSAAGGGGDFATRVIAQELTSTLGQQVIVDNRGITGAEVVAKAAPDGYTLLLYGSNVWISPLMRKTGWDPVKDFSPIMLAVSAQNVLVVHPAVAANSVKELIALAKAKPGVLNYASSGTGSSTHLAAELFKAMAGVDIVGINYKGVGMAINDVMAGRVQLMFANSGSLAPHIKSGKLRALAIGSDKPSDLVPGLPTVAATVPGYEAAVPYGMFAPAQTPPTLINRLNQETARALNKAHVRETLLNTGVEVVASSPAHFAAKIKAEMARLGKVIKDAGIKEE